MSIPIIIMGDSGTGKSYSLRNFSNDDVSVLNVQNKLLPFFDNALDTVSIPDLARDNGNALRVDIVQSWLANHHEKRAVVIDDCGYCISEMFVRWNTGAEAYDNKYAVYTDIAARMWNLFQAVIEDGDATRIVYFVFHQEKQQDGSIDILTVGKLLNEKLLIRGLVTCTLQSAKEGDRYGFHTNNANPAKCPPGLFEDEFIDNDLKAVDARIREAYRLDNGK
ncbi:MAG: AAA family ATPase [Eggerthellaceae bacterium]|nr:AAA family ATPase [Eggerthellaceae bacterium]